MPQYKYRAYNQAGEFISGSVDAQDETTLAAKLSKSGLNVVKIAASKQAGLSVVELLESHKGINKQEIIIATRQLATLIRTGQSLLPSLDTICEQTTNDKFRQVLDGVRQSVQKGASLSAALSNHPQVFSELFISMVQVGETGGMLDSVLDRLARLGTQELET
ncbi:type II secretion system F family protein, partial [Candidatus Omnitrophota bacterium]